MTTYKLIFKLSAILVFFYLDIVASNNTTALGSILLNSLCLIITK